MPIPVPRRRSTGRSRARLGLPVSGPALRALAASPGLWPTAWRQWRVLFAPLWWAVISPRPGPRYAYARFRLETMFGSEAGHIGAEELIAYLRWCRWMRRLTR